MVNAITDRIAQVSDRMLAKVAPKKDADAQCGHWVLCCGWNGVFWELGQWRRDVEHNGICTPCYALGVRC